MRYIQSLVLDNKTEQLNSMASQIEGELEDMDSLIQYVNGQSHYYGPFVEEDAATIGTTMNICIGL